MAYAPLTDKPKRVITTEQERLGLIAEITGLKLPFTCQISQGVKRTSKQNSLQHLWESQLAKQSVDMTAEDWRSGRQQLCTSENKWSKMCAVLLFALNADKAHE